MSKQNKQNNTTKKSNKKWSTKRKVITFASIITAALLVIGASVAIPLVVYNTHAAGVTPESSNQAETYEVKFDEGNLTSTLYLNGKEVKVEDATVKGSVTSKIIIPATCEADGEIEYTATVNYNGKTYTNTKKEVLKASGHIFNFKDFVWSEDNEKCIAVFVCAEDATHQRNIDVKVTKTVTEATCTTAGKVVYSVYYDVDDLTYMDSKEVPLDPLNHNYEFSKFVIADDLSSAQALFICMNDISHVELRDATITHTTTLAPTCHKSGIETYTIAYDDHVETREVVLDALGHDFIDAYKSDNIHVQTCSRCGAERLEYNNENGNTTTNTIVLYDSEEE